MFYTVSNNGRIRGIIFIMALVIRAKDDAQTVIAAGDDDSDAVVVLEENWYFAPELVDMAYLTKTERTYNCPYKGIAYWYDLDAPNAQAKNIAWAYDDPADDYEHIAGYIAFYPRETAGTLASEEDEATV